MRGGVVLETCRKMSSTKAAGCGRDGLGQYWADI